MALKKTVLSDVSGLLRHRRRSLGLTQKQLGEKLGIDQRTVSSLEKNPGSISAARFFAVIEALELDLYTSTDPRDAVLAARMAADQADAAAARAVSMIRNIRTA